MDAARSKREIPSDVYVFLMHILTKKRMQRRWQCPAGLLRNAKAENDYGENKEQERRKIVSFNKCE